jgi:hypothetical protein
VLDILAGQDLTPAEAVLLVEVFGNYLLAESQVADGHTFRVTEGGRRWQLSHTRCERYSEGDAYFNPWGYWRLVRLAD